MIKVYGKNNCPNCNRIKKTLESIGVEFEYIKDDIVLMEIAKDLYSKGKLIETTAPIVLVDGEQILHRDIQKL